MAAAMTAFVDEFTSRISVGAGDLRNFNSQLAYCCAEYFA